VQPIWYAEPPPDAVAAATRSRLDFDLVLQKRRTARRFKASEKSKTV